jgi:hypothetical protein
MTDKTINLAITGDGTVIDAAMDAFVKQNGWTAESTETQEHKARDVLRAFIMQSVEAYNINQAKDAAAAAAKAQTEAALDLTTMTLTVA